jgi:hypothetical protein
MFTRMPSRNTTTWAVLAGVVAVIIVVGAIFAYNNSRGNDTSGDDTRLPATDLNARTSIAPVGPATA